MLPVLSTLGQPIMFICTIAYLNGMDIESTQSSPNALHGGLIGGGWIECWPTYPAYYMTAPLAVTIYLLPVTSYELGYSGRWPCVGDLICEHAIHLHLPARCQYLHLGKSKSFSANSRMKSVRWSESGCIGCTGWAAGTFYNGNTWCHINVNIINFMF